MYCANLKEIQRMSKEFIRQYGLKTLKEDHDLAVKNNKANGVKQIPQGIMSYGVQEIFTYGVQGIMSY